MPIREPPGDFDSDDVADFLRSNPQLRSVELLLVDTQGVMRGKRTIADDLPTIYRNGVNFPGSVFAMDISGATIESTGLGYHTGDPDQICWPVEGSLRIVPWSDGQAAQLILAMYDLEGRRYFADPRAVLARVTERFSELELTPDVAIELEFYIFKAEQGRPTPPIWPRREIADTSTQCYGMDQLDDCAKLIDDVLAAAEQQGVPAESTISEFAPGQYEINLEHVADPMAACDDAVLLKRIIKAIAEQHGFQATFMAKPYAGLSGSGMHIHASIREPNGDNVFAGPLTEITPPFAHAIAGLSATCGDFMALFAPNVNSYRRFERGTYAPTSNSWGINNRTVAFRVPLSDPASRRIEHRVSGADANPYLVMAGVLAGIHHGIGEAPELDQPIERNAYDERTPNLPDTWLAALYSFQESELAERYLGADYCRVYTAIKLAERQKFECCVSDQEYQWYLRSV
jgi:glutamine synthetase